METKTSQFHYAKFDSILDGSVILPTRICPLCTTEVSEFWVTECNACHSTLGNAKMIFDPKNKDIDYLVLDDPELIKKFQNEATWLCTNKIGTSTKCLSLNSEDSEICSNLQCMASRAEHGYTIPKYQSNESSFSTPAEVLMPIIGEDQIVIAEAEQSLTQKVKENVKQKVSESTPIKIGLSIFATLVVAWQSMFWFGASTVEGKVQHYNWHTSVRIEHIVSNTYSDWNTPIDAYNISSSQQIKSYDTVKSGSHTELQTRTRKVQNGTESYDCSTTSGATIVKNTCSRPTYSTESYNESVDVPDYTEVPIYASWYTYSQDTWDFYKSLDLDGQDNTPTFLPYNPGIKERIAKRCSATLEVNRNGQLETVDNSTCTNILDFKKGTQVSYSHNRLNANWAPKIK
jgi:hypothetical protein